MHGDEILRELRSPESDLLPNARIIVLTKFEQDEESRMAMEHDDVLLYKGTDFDHTDVRSAMV